MVTVRCWTAKLNMYPEDTIPIGFETQEVFFWSEWEQFLKLNWIKYFANDRWHSENISPFCRCNISIPSTLHTKFIYKTNQLHWKAIKETRMDKKYKYIHIYLHVRTCVCVCVCAQMCTMCLCVYVHVRPTLLTFKQPHWYSNFCIWVTKHMSII